MHRRVAVVQLSFLNKAVYLLVAIPNETTVLFLLIVVYFKNCTFNTEIFKKTHLCKNVSYFSYLSEPGCAEVSFTIFTALERLMAVGREDKINFPFSSIVSSRSPSEPVFSKFTRSRRRPLIPTIAIRGAPLTYKHFTED